MRITYLLANLPATALKRCKALRPAKPRHVPGWKPALEVLEDRIAPAILTVNTLADNTTDTSVLTLRDAVALVNSGGDPASLGQSSMPANWAAQINTRAPFGSNDTIQFDPSLFGASAAIIALNGSELSLNSNVTINGPGAGQLALDGGHHAGQTDGGRVLEVAPGAVVSLSGLTIQNGFTSEANADDYGSLGGGILNFGSLTLSNCAVSNNWAVADYGGVGGGILNMGSLILGNCAVSNNNAASGGGIANGLGNGDGSELTVTGSTFSGNQGSAVLGLGLGLLFQNCTFSHNSSDYGGAIEVETDQVTVDACTFSDNVADTGGAIAVGFGALGDQESLAVSNSTFSGNYASFRGGAIAYIDWNPYVFGFAAGGSAHMIISNSTLAYNTADVWGGAIYFYGSDASVPESVLTNVTIAENRCNPSGADLGKLGFFGYGGGVYVDSQPNHLNVYNTIVAQNYHGAGPGTPDDVVFLVDSPAVTT